MSVSGLRDTIAYEIASRVRGLAPEARFMESDPRYVTDVAMNLAPGVDFEDARRDFRGESGAVFEGGLAGPDKLCAVHSSAAILLNTFGPLRARPELLRLLGYQGFRYAAFEEQLPTGLHDTPPNLDLCAYGDEAIVCVESKLTEMLAGRSANLTESQMKAVREVAEPAWVDMYRSLCARPRRFRYLDAARLVRHYLGIRHALADEGVPKWLLYLFWEPLDWARVPEFSQHRYETLAFSVAVSGGDVRFIAMSYADLWDAMGDWPDWSEKNEQLRYLRDRYLFEL